jgi:hypothetical protein
MDREMGAVPEMVYAEGGASRHYNYSTELLPDTPVQPSPLPSLLLRSLRVVSGIHLPSRQPLYRQYVSRNACGPGQG